MAVDSEFYGWRGRGLMGNSTRSYVSPGAQKPPILKLHTD